MRLAWKTYSKWMGKQPLKTSMATSATVMVCGDLLAQRMEKRREFDWRRNLVVGSWNGLVFSPVFFLWFRFLDRWFPKTTFRHALAKVAVNQLVMVLPINAGFLVYIRSMENLLYSRWKTSCFSELRAKVLNDSGEIFFKSLGLWGPVNMLNFLLVPPKFRILPTIGASFVWSTILSLVAHRAEEFSPSQHL